MTSTDYLNKAILLAKRANPKNIRPNPFVGAIIVSKEGKIVGEGIHEFIGEAHAEVMAINNALHNNADLPSCTLYVTLEPCSHIGKTPPCTSLILQHNIPKVVIGSMDPNPQVSGAKLLTEKGIKVEEFILPEIIEMNSVFNINQIYRRPKYILKSATTLNGKIADRFGDSKWISNVKSREYVHQILRTNADAVLTTASTVLKDSATMNIRAEGTIVQELNVVIIDKNLLLLKEENKNHPIFYNRVNTKIYLVTDMKYDGQLRADVELLNVPVMDGKCDLKNLSEQLLQKNICEVLVEAGAFLNTSLIEAKLIDEMVMFICPSIIMDNNSINIFNSSTIQKIENSIKLQLVESHILDTDILARYKLLY